MAIPLNARRIDEQLDPYDIVDIEAELLRDDSDPSRIPILEEGESVSSFALALTAEAVAVGMQIKNTAPYPAPTINGERLRLWIGFDDAVQGNPVFDGAGVTVALELSIVTTNVPPRRRQKSFTITAAHQ